MYVTVEGGGSAADEKERENLVGAIPTRVKIPGTRVP